MMHDWFVNARYGMSVHYGLYSPVGCGEWLMNREEIPPAEYARLADRFTAEAFDAAALSSRLGRQWAVSGCVRFRSSRNDRNTGNVDLRREAERPQLVRA
jgi:hypothetical protein